MQPFSSMCHDADVTRPYINDMRTQYEYFQMYLYNEEYLKNVNRR